MKEKPITTTFTVNCPTVEDRIRLRRVIKKLSMEQNITMFQVLMNLIKNER